MARSTLELLLDSINEREEEPPDHLPVLPQRPTSRARLPSRKRTSALPFSDSRLEQQNGHTQRHGLHASDTCHTQHSNGNGFDGQSEAALPPAALVHRYDEESAQTVQNAGDQLKKMSRCNEESLSGERNNAEESTLDSRKQETTYTSLKKRRRNHCVQGLQQDSRVWLLNQEKKWMIGVIQSTDDLGSAVCMSDGKFLRVLPEKLLPANPELLDGVDALEQLSYIHEPAIFHNLQCRYQLGKFCTRAGASMIAFTPPKGSRFCKQFSQNPLEASKLTVKDSKQPHVHTIAYNALDALKRDWRDQSIILSGDCGAGKTESVKSILQYLVSCGGNTELGNAFLLSNSVLEAFGSANITNSTNASRFGQVMDINFDTSGKFCSASCQIVFFEKSRVVRRADGEHSYHIFYQLCEGTDPFLREKLNLRGAMEFDYLKKSGFDGVNKAYRSEFRALLNALHTLGFSEKVQREIFSLLAAVLWLGNINTDAADTKNEAVDNAAKLLKCSRKDLIEAIGFGRLNPDNVLAVRDALACAIYERLFYWIVAQINNLLKLKEACDVKSISVVDLPGFGFSKSNGLEGLLVNYAHEHLQQFTQWHLLQQEEEEQAVACGGLSSLVTNSSRDDETIDFLEHELFPSLIEEEAGALSVGAESRLLQRLEKLTAASSCCKWSQSKILTVSHCFGEAIYNASSFFKEIKSSASPQTEQILQSCMMNLLEGSTIAHNELSRKSFPQDSSFQRAFLSAGQIQVLQIMQQLDNTAPHFIFCISSSESQITLSLDQEHVLRQLRISRVMEAVRLCMPGYCKSISHGLFASRFGVLLGPNVKVVHDTLGVCIAVLQKLEVPPHLYKVGLTKLYFPPGQVEKLEDAREEFLNKVVGIQKTYRGYKIRSELKRQKMAVSLLQASVRSWLARKGYIHHYSESESAERSSTYENKMEMQPSTGIRIKDVGSCKAILNDGDHLTKKEDVTSSLQVLPDQSKREVKQSKQEDDFVQVKDPDWQSDDEKRLEGSALDRARMQTMPAEVLLQKKEEQNVLLQQSLKECERKYLAYESKMKLMEEMWQKQIASLEQRLSAAGKGSNAEEPANKTADSDHSGVRSTTPLVASARETPETTSAEPDLAVGRSELDPSRSVLDHLSKELEHRTQVFNDDAKFLVEVKSGQIEANFKPDEELRKLGQRFDVWKKDYKSRLKETKGILKKLGKLDSSEKSKKKWWSRN